MDCSSFRVWYREQLRIQHPPVTFEDRARRAMLQDAVLARELYQRDCTGASEYSYPTLPPGNLGAVEGAEEGT